MTTETLEAQHLYLAENLPSLRQENQWVFGARGWIPNVTTDALLEALREA